jgi:hypothetical protein
MQIEMDNQQLGHLLGQLATAALVLFFIYRRFRRNFGKQLLRRGAMIFRLVLLSLLGLFLLPAATASLNLALVTAAGLAVGIGLGVWAAKHLRFEKHDDKLYYIPHTYVGMIVTALFLGRILYRFIAVFPIVSSAMRSDSYTPSNDDLNTLQTYTHNPITRGILFVLIGYYVYYYLYVLWESRHLKPSDFENATASTQPKAD